MTVKRTRTKKSPSVDSDEYTPDVALPTPDQSSAPKRYRLRSGAVGRIAGDGDSSNKENPAAIVAKATKPKETKPKSGPKPFIEYKGAVEYYTLFGDIETACAKLL